MKRLVIAFFVAPLPVPLIVALVSKLIIFPYPGQGPWVLFATGISAIVTYGGVFLLGLPAFYFMRSKKFVSKRAAGGLGFIVGEVMWLVFGAWFSKSLGQSSWKVFEQGKILLQLFWMIPPGLLGMMVGLIFWRIARPALESFEESEQIS